MSLQNHAMLTTAETLAVLPRRISTFVDVQILSRHRIEIEISLSPKSLFTFSDMVSGFFTNTTQNISEFDKLTLHLMFNAAQRWKPPWSSTLAEHWIYTEPVYWHTCFQLLQMFRFPKGRVDLWDEICSATRLSADASCQTHLNCLIANPLLIPLYISMFIHGVTHTVAHQEVAGGRVAGCCAFPSRQHVKGRHTKE